MPKTLIALRVDDGLLKTIDELADKEGTTRTEIIEGLLERGVDDEMRFVGMIDKPMLRMMWKGLASAGVIDVVLKALGDQVDQRRIKLARDGLKRKARAAAKLKGAES